MNERVRIDQYLSPLIGALCWTVIGDQYSDVHIGFGSKVTRTKALSNTALSEEERLYRPEFDVFIRCSWRLQTPDTVLAGDVQGGEALKTLVGRVVESASTAAPGWDLVLGFSGGLELVVFSNETREGYDNFSVGVQNSYLTVQASSVVHWE